MEFNRTLHNEHHGVRKGTGPLLALLAAAIVTGFCVPTGTAGVSERQALRTQLISMYEQLASPPYGDTRSSLLLLTGDCSFTRESLEAEILQEQSRLADRDRGLELRGAFSTGGLSGSDSDSEGLQRGRGNIELSWDVLKDGYLQHSTRGEALSLQAREEELLHEQKEIVHELRCRRQQIEAAFGQVLATLLTRQLHFLEPVYRIERRAYFKQWSFLDDYLVSEQDLVLIKQELGHLNNTPLMEHAILLERLPPIIDVDLAGLFRLIETDERLAALFDVRKNRYEQEDRSVYHDTFRLYLRQEFDVNSSTGEQNDLVAGLRFRVPLYGRDSRLQDLYLRRLERQRDALQWDRFTNTRAAFRALQEQLRRTLAQHYRHARALERMRRTLLMLEQGDSQLLTTGITRMRTLFAARIELVRSLKELYGRVNELFLVAGIPFHSELVAPVVLDPDLQRARTGRRSVYIWSEDLGILPQKELLHFLEAKNISRVMLSSSRNIEASRRDEFIGELQNRAVKVEMVLGESNWILPEKRLHAIETILTAAELTGSIHLDVEPHTLPDYRERRAEYLLLYQELIEELHSAMLDRALTVAVPFHWPLACYRHVAAAVDTVYVMAYGSERADTLIRRVKRMQPAVPVEKLGVALRSSDFVDEWALEQLIDRLVVETGVEHIAIHDLGEYLTLTSLPHEAEN